MLDTGRSVKLRKVLSEKWIKKRGEADRLFDGNETSHFIDDVPKSKNEYTAYVCSLIDEDTFKLITNPSYFNTDTTTFNWRDRRERLFELSNYSLTDSDIIASAPEFSFLKEAVEGRSIEDAKKISQAQIKRTNDEIAKIPIRIDELTRTLPGLAELSAGEWDRISKVRETALANITAINAQLADAQGMVQNRAHKLMAIEDCRVQLKARETELRAAARREIDEATAEINRLQLTIGQKNSQLSDINLNIRNIQASKKALEDKLPVLRTQYNELRGLQFVTPADAENH